MIQPSRPIIQEGVERYLDCGNPRSGFARIRCPDCRSEHLLILAHEVLRLLVDRGLLSPEWAERILSWRHTGFNVHSRVRARTKTEAEQIGKYMVRPILALERLSFLEQEGKILYRHGDEGAELERMDYLELIARVTSHIPDKGQVTVRYYGLYANAHRGKVRKAGRPGFPVRIVEEEPRCLPAKGWAAMIRKVYEVDPMTCPRCGGRMKVVAFLTEYAVVDRIIRHLLLGHIIKTKEGKEVGSVSNIAGSMPLPPGEYTIEIQGKIIPFNLAEGQELTFELK